MNFAEIFHHGASSVGAAAYSHSAMLAGRASMLTRTCVICQRSLCESMCDPCAIRQRSLCDPHAFCAILMKCIPIFTSDPARVLTFVIILKGRWLCWVLFLRSCLPYLRLRTGISRSLPWLLFCMAAILDSAIVHSPPKWLNAN